jgi:hypothetical protein
MSAEVCLSRTAFEAWPNVAPQILTIPDENDLIPSCSGIGEGLEPAGQAEKIEGPPGRPKRSFNISGRLLDLCTGGLSPSRIQLGNLCLSTSLARGPPTDVMAGPSLQATIQYMAVSNGNERRPALSPLFNFSTSSAFVRPCGP